MTKKWFSAEVWQFLTKGSKREGKENRGKEKKIEERKGKLVFENFEGKRVLSRTTPDGPWVMRLFRPESEAVLPTLNSEGNLFDSEVLPSTNSVVHSCSSGHGAETFRPRDQLTPYKNRKALKTGVQNLSDHQIAWSVNKFLTRTTPKKIFGKNSDI